MFLNRTKLVFLLVLGSSNAFTVNHHLLTQSKSCHRNIFELNAISDINGDNSYGNGKSDINTATDRRGYLTKSLVALSVAFASTATPLTANAFDNKITNAYDDKIKRRGPQPKDLGISKRKDMVGEEYLGLKNCGPAPNCFCSTDDAEDDPDHSIPSWTFPKDLTKEQAFEQLQEVIQKYTPGQGNIDGGGFKIVTADATKGYIYVQFEAVKNGYIDDLEMAYMSKLGDNSVQVRSSSRVGYLDYGVNSKRVNYIAKIMRDLGWNAPGVEYSTHKGYYSENQVKP
jgi:uncharacterized protein (DUF1499 family)